MTLWVKVANCKSSSCFLPTKKKKKVKERKVIFMHARDNNSLIFYVFNILEKDM